MDHYYRLPDNSAWSTARKIYVQADDHLFSEWLSVGLVPTEAADEAAIDDALRTAGLADLSPLPRRDISPLAFRRRFRAEERLAIHTAALTVPQVAIWVADQAASQTTDVLDPDTISGIDGLIAAGLIAPERKADILRRGE